MSSKKINFSVGILLCTFNGEEFLEEQLESIENQTFKNWCLIVSDDGSNDSTLNILNKFKKKWSSKKVKIRKGPKKGYALNFLSLLVDNSLKYDFYAFCDQDDIWFPQKLDNAIEVFNKYNKKFPILYGSRTTLIDTCGKIIGKSPFFSGKKNFSNAILQNFAGGNTMVFNNEAKKNLEKFKFINVISHDWWVYLVICSINGKVYYDLNASIYYRQHKNNQIGGKQISFHKILKVLHLIFGETYNQVSNNIENLLMNKRFLSENALFHINEIINLRRKTTISRLKYFLKSKLNRQTFLSRLSLLMCIILNKL